MLSRRSILISFCTLATLSSSSFAKSVFDNYKSPSSREASELTADDQSLNKKDTEITRQIRHDLLKNQTLSVDAKNVKVITVKGLVTLRGPVDSKDEELKVVRTASAVVDPSRIVNELDISAVSTSER